MFCFLIDPTGWTEIGGETFAPGFFLWNSEVGRRSLGVETFWFQAVCQNHVVWDAVEVVDFSRKHTTNVRDALFEIRRIIHELAARRDQRRDAFARVMQRAMETKLGDDADAVQKELSKAGIGRALARQAIELAQQQGRFTVFALVDALTRLSKKIVNAGDRTEVDQQAGKLLALAA
jgi:histone H3/H4